MAVRYCIFISINCATLLTESSSHSLFNFVGVCRRDWLETERKREEVSVMGQRILTEVLLFPRPAT